MRSLLLAALFVAVTGAEPSVLAAEGKTDGSRAVKISWAPLDGAVQYELELSSKPELEPLLTHEKYDEAKASLDLKPGVYYFRVRGIVKSGASGPWSETTKIGVSPSTLKPLIPRDKQVFQEKMKDDSLLFQWEGATPGTPYLLELINQDGKVYRREVSGSEYNWKSMLPGSYRWRLGYEAQSGEKWGDYREFSVEKTAIVLEDEDATFRQGMKMQTPETGESRASELWLIARYAQAAVVYNSNDVDSGIAGTGAATVGLVSAELRWRQNKKADQLWTLSASANFEMIHQNVLDSSFYLPRVYARVFYGRELGLWRVSPFLQLGMGQSGIFVAESDNTAIATKVSRTSFGLGTAATYRVAQTFLVSALAVLRMDMGAQADSLPSPVQSSIAFEAGFGFDVNISQGWIMEGRLRALQESFSWLPASGGSVNSSLSDLFLIGDIGVGYRF